MRASTLGPMTVISMEGVAKTPSEKVFRGAWRGSLAVLTGLLIFMAWLVRTGGFYESGSDFGYNLGLVGGLLMLTLLLYPLRKRVAWLDRLGSMEGWFKYHMIAGITGPLLVLFHSTFRTGSLNGAMALYAMLLVAISGIIGRFIYRHIHRGLYGEHLTLADVSAELKAAAESMDSIFALRPDIEPRLRAFRELAFDNQGSLGARVWKFVTLRWKSRRLAKVIREDAKSILRRQWRKRGGNRKAFVASYLSARERIDRYLDSVVKAAQLKVWERLFSY